MAQTEQQSARAELLAVLEALLGDGTGPAKPDTLEALHNVAIATREYLQAEEAEEAAAKEPEAAPPHDPECSSGPLGDWCCDCGAINHEDEPR